MKKLEMAGRSIILIVGIVGCSFLTVVILYGLSDTPVSYNHDFTRTFRQDVIRKRSVMSLKPDSYIAGATAQRIFFGNEKNMLDLFVTDLELSTSSLVKLQVEGEGNPRLKGSYIEIDSPSFYIKAGELPGIFKGELGHWVASRVLDHVPHFSQAVLVADNCLALLSTGTAEGSLIREHILCRVSTDNSHISAVALVRDAQVEDFFRAVGILRYSKCLNRLVYTYLYSNQYLVLDSSLTLVNKGNTIDPVSHPQMKLVEVAEGRYSMASTSPLVNNNAQVYGKWLFVHSNLMATNETREVFDSMSVIDVYDLEATRYHFSFYIPEHENIEMENFRVFGDRIIVLYSRYAVCYSLNKNAI